MGKGQPPLLWKCWKKTHIDIIHTTVYSQRHSLTPELTEYQVQENDLTPLYPRVWVGKMDTVGLKRKTVQAPLR
jgi:hypothetical protein